MEYSAMLWLKLRFTAFAIGVYILKMFGLAPFTFRGNITCNVNEPSHQIRPFRYSKVGSVYNLMLAVLVFSVLVAMFLTIFRLDSNESSISNDIMNAVVITRRSLMIGDTVLIIIVWSLRQRKATTKLNLLFETSARLSWLKQQPSQKWIIVSSISNITIIAYIMIMVSTKAMEYTNFLIFTTKFFRVLPGLVIFYFELEYTIVAGFMARKFETVNHCLANYRKLSYSPLPSILDDTVIVIHDNDRAASLRLLRSIRATLVELCDDITDFFSIPILLSVVISTLSFISDIFNIFVKTYQPDRTYSKWVTGSSSNWVILTVGAFIYPVVILTLMITRVKGEARRTGPIVRKLLLASKKGSKIRTELKQFSEELLHDKVDVFMTLGVFHLDASLIPSILGSTATYFIVLLQLRSPSAHPQLFCNCTIFRNNSL